MSLIVKICGLSTRETLDVALSAGADMVGFVFFPPSPRHLSLAIARGLKIKMPRRRRKEHEAHHVRAGIQRDVERLARGQAANFDDQGHGATAKQD